MSRLNFFTTRADIVRIAEAVDACMELRFTQTGNETHPDLTIFVGMASIPRLGQPQSGNLAGAVRYLVTNPRERVNVRVIETTRGQRRYLVDQLVNPDSVVFSGGGEYGTSLVLQGEVGTASKTEVAKHIMNVFRKALRKYCVRIQDCWIGPEALTRLDRGDRLTCSEHASAELDLRR